MEFTSGDYQCRRRPWDTYLTDHSKKSKCTRDPPCTLCAYWWCNTSSAAHAGLGTRLIRSTILLGAKGLFNRLSSARETICIENNLTTCTVRVLQNLRNKNLRTEDLIFFIKSLVLFVCMQLFKVSPTVFLVAEWQLSDIDMSGTAIENPNAITIEEERLNPIPEADMDTGDAPQDINDAVLFTNPGSFNSSSFDDLTEDNTGTANGHDTLQDMDASILQDTNRVALQDNYRSPILLFVTCKMLTPVGIMVMFQMTTYMQLPLGTTRSKVPSMTSLLITCWMWA